MMMQESRIQSRSIQIFIFISCMMSSQVKSSNIMAPGVDLEGEPLSTFE
jgi:hypothetical protein